MSFFDRVKTSYKAHSVQMLAVLASQPVWYPFVRPFAEAVAGPENAELVTNTVAGIIGILGYARRQKSLQPVK